MIDWDVVGAIAELAGAIGVILSLVYLALQIRQSNATDKLTATLSLQESYNQVGDSFLRDSEKLSNGLSDFLTLSPEDQLKFAVAYHLLFGHMELIFGHQKRGVVDSDLSNRCFHTMRSHYAFPGVRQWWKAVGKAAFSSDFVDFVESGEKGAVLDTSST